MNETILEYVKRISDPLTPPVHAEIRECANTERNHIDADVFINERWHEARHSNGYGVLTVHFPTRTAAESLLELARALGWHVFSVEGRDGRRRVEVTL